MSAEYFINIDLDRKSNVKYRNPNTLYDYIMERTTNPARKFYVLIDEIQLSYKVKNTDIDESLVPEEDCEMLYTTFYDILNNGPDDMRAYNTCHGYINFSYRT